MTPRQNDQENALGVKDWCRICGNNRLYPVFDFGNMPPANILFPREKTGREQFFPLELVACLPCAYMQLRHVVSPNLLFHDYAYMASSSLPYLEHFAALAAMLTASFGLSKQSLVLDIGSNDGSLLKAFQPYGVRTLGIDPAQNLAQHATAQGIQTIPAYFTGKNALQLVRRFGHARLITATNVFAHIDNLRDFLFGIETMLATDGVFFAQFPSLADLLSKNAFDTVYHEHLSYFSATALQRLFAKTSLDLFSLDFSPIHGGSLRIFVQKKDGPHRRNREAMRQFLAKERSLKLHTRTPFLHFAKNIRMTQQHFRRLLTRLRAQKKRIVGLGAPAKGITLINVLKLTSKEIEYITDTTPSKQGLLTPLSHIPIVGEEMLRKRPPDYAIIFAWNFADEIIQKTQFLRRFGTRYILPVPKVTIVA